MADSACRSTGPFSPCSRGEVALSAIADSSGAAVGLLERTRLEAMAAEQGIEVGAIALRQARGLADVAGRRLQQLREVLALELPPRLIERQHLPAALRLVGQCALDQLHGDQRA